MPAGFFLFLVAMQAALPSAPDELRRGRNSFDRGEYARAIEILNPLLYPDIRLESESQILQAHRMLGVSNLFEGHNDVAAQEFRQLLQLRPDYRFDPLLDPPQVVDFFNGVLRHHEAEVGLLEAKRRDAELARQRYRQECEKARAGPTVVEKRVGRNSFAVNFIPFGAGQFQNGQRNKGWAFLISESIFAGASVGAFATNLALYGLRPKRLCLIDSGSSSCPSEYIDHTDENRSRLIMRIQVASGALFFATAAWGIVDALRHYRSETVLSDSGTKTDRGNAYAPHLFPVLVGRTLGPGLAFRF